MITNKNYQIEDCNYKYLIHKFLNELPHARYKITQKHLPKKIGVSAETFRKWKYIKIDDTATIPADKLAIIAKFFDLKMEEIFNYIIPTLNYSELEEAELEENNKLKNV